MEFVIKLLYSLFVITVVITIVGLVFAGILCVCVKLWNVIFSTKPATE